MTNQQKVFLDNFSKLHSSGQVLNYYLLPVVNVVVAGMRMKNVIIKVSKDRQFIYVKSTPFLLKKSVEQLTASDCYQNMITLDDQEEWFLFLVPSLYIREVSIILNGNVVDLMEGTKRKICNMSGLAFNAVKSKTKLSVADTHVYLQLLFKRNPMKTLLSAYFGVELDAVADNLIGSIPDDSALYMENFINHSKIN